MIVPTVKTLITYIKDNEVKKVLCNIETRDDKYAQVEYEHDIIARCPFENYTLHESIYNVEGNKYEITLDNGSMTMGKIDVIVNSVLEFNEKIFLLEEIQYDMKEFED